MSAPFIAMSAPNGARRGKADHAELPLTPAEIADCAGLVADAGASLLHLHVRDADGRHSLDADLYRAALAAIRQRVGKRIVVQVTTEACGIYAPAQQMAVVRELRPEAVSLALQELCPDAGHEAAAAKFFAELRARQTMVQYILYGPEDVLRFESLRQRGIVPDAKPFVLLVLVRYSESLTGDPAALDAWIEKLKPDVTWMVCCFGHTEHQAVAAAAALGGHARVGFENNLVLPDGSLAPDNAALVKLAAICATGVGRRLASADDVRQLLA
jgi:uncharacterized protein (DUF849 family)